MRVRFVAMIAAVVAALSISATAVSAPSADPDTRPTVVAGPDRPDGECASCV